ncbi:zinc finger protein 385D isoform X3 [Balaenoptera acutorostrata]|uniref:Zinc finger protein 385D isoform X3 n=1 Tax=Balaenoptera acutorostrata TaxID=9767 RepID=A0ABM3TIS4_BALAC|nr:zinc finger protein 385D isoform X3 [Balaenoptera acutorostrata]
MPGPGRRAAAGRKMKGSAGGRREKLLGSPKAQPGRASACAQDGESEAEFLPDDFEEKPEREKKHNNFTLCNVCNIQLNSAAQAQIHYNGKSHQKRLKQLSNGMVKNDNGGTCQSPALPALVRPPAPPLQPSLDIKPFLPFPLDTAAAVNLFPNFNAMDPIQKAVINHTFGVPLPHRRKQIISCNICQLRFNSDSQAAAHYKGTKHAKKLKALEAMKNKQKSVTAKDSAKTTFTSITTNTINTSSDKTGTKHKTMLEARNGSGTIKAFPRVGVKGKGPVNKGNTGLQNKTFHCEICDVHVNSETQLKQHISSRRHKDRAAGKPPKPKYSPYNKLQKAAHPLGVKLVFSKEPSKPLAPRILPNPLAAAAAAAAVAVNSPFSLRTAPAATLFQTSAVPPALLRPAPGPIRTAHTPVLFAPY